MADTKQKRLTLAELTEDQPESTDPAYLAWRDAEVRAAIADADANPDDDVSVDELLKKFKLEG